MIQRVILPISAALMLTACTSVNPYTGATQVSNTTGGTLLGAGGGAVAGAIVGTATGSDPRVAALIGGRTGDSTLTLITCGGEFNRELREYERRVVVHAVKVGASG